MPSSVAGPSKARRALRFWHAFQARVPEVIQIAQRTLREVKANLWFTAAYNLGGLTLAALGGLPPPWQLRPSHCRTWGSWRIHRVCHGNEREDSTNSSSLDFGPFRLNNRLLQAG